MYIVTRFILYIEELVNDIVNSDYSGIFVDEAVAALYILLFADDVAIFGDSVINLQKKIT